MRSALARYDGISDEPAFTVRYIETDDPKILNLQNKVRRELSRVHGRPDKLPQHRAPSYSDPAKRQDVAAAIAALSKRHDANKAERFMARPMANGYRPIASDGNFAIGELAPTEGKPFFSGAIRWIGTLDADAWRAYGMARTCRRKDGHGNAWTSWTLATDRITFHSIDRSGETGDVEATAWAPRAPLAAPFPADQCELIETCTLAFNDPYIWPLRGIEWRYGLMEVGKIDVLVLEAGGFRVMVAAGKLS